MQNLRTERAGSDVAKAISEILNTKVNDPRLKEFITITYCKVSPDFRHCKVGVSIYSGDEKVVLNSLKKCSGFIRRELMDMVRLPYSPELTFIVDKGAKHSENINKILETLDIPELEEEDNDDIDTDL